MVASQAVIRLSDGLGKALGVDVRGLKRGLSWQLTDQSKEQLKIEAQLSLPLPPQLSAGGKARGANVLIRGYAKSVVSPSRLATANGVAVQILGSTKARL
jgi:hypothetical protein